MTDDAKALLRTLVPRLNNMLCSLTKEQIISMYVGFNEEIEVKNIQYSSHSSLQKQFMIE